MAQDGHRAEARQLLRLRPGTQQRQLLSAAQHRIAQRIRHAAMIDAFAHQAVDGAALDDSHGECGIIAAREIQHRREAGPVHQVLEPLLAPPALDAIIEQHGVIADRGERRSAAVRTAAAHARGTPPPAR